MVFVLFTFPLEWSEGGGGGVFFPQKTVVRIKSVLFTLSHGRKKISFIYPPSRMVGNNSFI